MTKKQILTKIYENYNDFFTRENLSLEELKKAGCANNNYNLHFLLKYITLYSQGFFKNIEINWWLFLKCNRSIEDVKEYVKLWNESVFLREHGDFMELISNNSNPTNILKSIDFWKKEHQKLSEFFITFRDVMKLNSNIYNIDSYIEIYEKYKLKEEFRTIHPLITLDIKVESIPIFIKYWNNHKIIQDEIDLFGFLMSNPILEYIPEYIKLCEENPKLLNLKVLIENKIIPEDALKIIKLWEDYKDFFGEEKIPFFALWTLKIRPDSWRKIIELWDSKFFEKENLYLQDILFNCPSIYQLENFKKIKEMWENLNSDKEIPLTFLDFWISITEDNIQSIEKSVNDFIEIEDSYKLSFKDFLK